MRKNPVLPAVCITLISLATAALAVPFTIGTETSTTGNAYPFGTSPSTYIARYQQAYASSEFPGEYNITSLTFFDSAHISRTSSNGSFDIFLSTSANAVGSLSTSFAANVGSDNQFFGSFAITGGITQVPGNPLIFTGAPFAYDPLNGDLLMDVWLTVPPTLGGIAMFAADNSNASIQRIYGTVGTDTTTGGNNPLNYGLVTRFGDAASVVPVPGGFILVVIGIAASRHITRSRRVR
jgi:hypothetical protein